LADTSAALTAGAALSEPSVATRIFVGNKAIS
jgi:hypothetical protein